MWAHCLPCRLEWQERAVVEEGSQSLVAASEELVEEPNGSVAVEPVPAGGPVEVVCVDLSLRAVARDEGTTEFRIETEGEVHRPDDLFEG